MFLVIFYSCDKKVHYIEDLTGRVDSNGFHFLQGEVFIEGEQLYVSLNSKKYPEKINQVFDIIVVDHKSASHWNADRRLRDVVFMKSDISLGEKAINCRNGFNCWKLCNTKQLLDKTIKEDQYFDIILDFNQNKIYDPKVDIIDYVEFQDLDSLGRNSGGFQVMKISGKEENALSYLYETTECIISGPCSSRRKAEMRGVVYFPWNYKDNFSKGIRHPLIMAAHGNYSKETDRKPSYLGFDYLAEELVNKGYIFVSIDLSQFGNEHFIYKGSSLVFEHLNFLLETDTTNFVKDTIRSLIDKENIGLLGHSRGGESIVIADHKNHNEFESKFAIKALCLLSPTDWTGKVECYSYQAESPLLMIYGTRDGDLSEGQGYRVLDQANNTKFSITVFGGIHNYFNNNWSRLDIPEDQVKPILETYQRDVTKFFAGCFFDAYLRGEKSNLEVFSEEVDLTVISEFKDEIKGELKGKLIFSSSYQGVADICLKVDQFDNLGSFEQNGLCVDNEGVNIGSIKEVWLGKQEKNCYPYYSYGLYADWEEPKNAFFQFGLNCRNLLYYKYLSFRIGQSFDKDENLNPKLKAQNISIQMEDSSGRQTRLITLSEFSPDSIPFPDINLKPALWTTKSLLQTVRIPLSAFSVGDSIIDLRAVDKLKFIFNKTEQGALLIDDVEFIGLDITEPDPLPADIRISKNQIVRPIELAPGKGLSPKTEILNALLGKINIDTCELKLKPKPPQINEENIAPMFIQQNKINNDPSYSAAYESLYTLNYPLPKCMILTYDEAKVLTENFPAGNTYFTFDVAGYQITSAYKTIEVNKGFRIHEHQFIYESNSSAIYGYLTASQLKNLDDINIFQLDIGTNGKKAGCIFKK
jgi:hypothetical protein